MVHGSIVLLLTNMSHSCTINAWFYCEEGNACARADSPHEGRREHAARGMGGCGTPQLLDALPRKHTSRRNTQTQPEAAFPEAD